MKLRSLLNKKIICMNFIAFTQIYSSPMAMEVPSSHVVQHQQSVSLHEQFLEMIKNTPNDPYIKKDLESQSSYSSSHSLYDKFQSLFVRYVQAEGKDKTIALSNGMLIPIYGEADTDKLAEFCLKNSSFSLNLNELRIFIQASKLFGENDPYTHKRLFDSQFFSHILQSYPPEKSKPTLTTYGLFAHILNAADSLKAKNDTDPTFIKNYATLSELLDYPARQQREKIEAQRKQLNENLCWKGSIYLSDLIMKGIREGKIDETWLYNEVYKK